MSALVALVPIPSSSMSFRRLPGLYRLGGFVYLLLEPTFAMGTISPSLRAGRATSFSLR